MPLSVSVSGTCSSFLVMIMSPFLRCQIFIQVLYANRLKFIIIVVRIIILGGDFLSDAPFCDLERNHKKNKKQEKKTKSGLELLSPSPSPSP